MLSAPHPAWLAALGSSLLNSFWQMALLWVAYQLLTAMNPRLSAAAKHRLALVFMNAGSIWFGLSLVNGLFAGNQTPNGLPTLMMNPDSLWMNGFYPSKKTVQYLLPYLSYAYLLSIVFLVFRYFGFYRVLGRLKTGGLTKCPAHLRSFVQSMSYHMGIRKKVSIWYSSLVESPLTIGFFKPMILVPIAVLNHLSTEQVEAILLHELAHIRRNDYLINVLVTWTGILFFFNPFYRFFIRQIRSERENCCDDLVLQFQYNAHSYASALLSLEKNRVQPLHLALAAVGSYRPLLLERVRRLTGQPRTKRAHHAVMLPFLMMSVALGFILLIEQRVVAKRKAVAAAVVKSPVTESLNKLFITPIPAREKTKQALVTTKKRKPVVGEGVRTAEVDTDTWAVSTSETEPSITVVAAAILPEYREYSITTNTEATAPAAAYDAGVPFVPQSSFSFNIEDDTSRPGRTEDREARLSMARSLQALKSLNWKKLEKSVNAKQKGQAQTMQLERELDRSLRALDWTKINADVDVQLSDAAVQRLKEAIVLQKQQLNNNTELNEEQIRTMQKEIRINQLRLQESVIKKQLQVIQKEQQQVRKVAKIVYI